MILNLQDKNELFDDDIQVENKDSIHIRIQQRNGRKSICTITGLASDLNLKAILKALKKTLNCNGAIIEDEDLGNIIQLQGDHRTIVRDFLVEQEICLPTDIIIHGF